ncbi:MAG: class I SAM-dependent methyltransferase [Acidimicrobiia bacterium]
MVDDTKRIQRRDTFDAAAELYQRARPEYPESVYEQLLTVTELSADAHLLEIGCATGKATLPLARRGFRITCIEPGPALAAEARRNLAEYDVDVVESRFEDWAPGVERYDMVYAASAWHWIDPTVRYQRAADTLRAGGYLAIWGAGHVIPVNGDPFFDEIQEIYVEIGDADKPPGNPGPRPGQLEDLREEILASDLFDVLVVEQFDWELRYDADTYIDLLDTFSGHIAMEDWKRDRLYGEIRRRLAERPDGELRRHWGGVLHIARRRPST